MYTYRVWQEWRLWPKQQWPRWKECKPYLNGMSCEVVRWWNGRSRWYWVISIKECSGNFSKSLDSCTWNETGILRIPAGKDLAYMVMLLMLQGWAPQGSQYVSVLVVMGIQSFSSTVNWPLPSVLDSNVILLIILIHGDVYSQVQLSLDDKL